MFAIFFSEKMDEFYQILLTFPVVIFSTLLIICILFGVISLLGLFNIDLPGVDAEIEGDSVSHVLAGLMMRLGLTGIPFPLIFFLITLIGWAISFTAIYYLQNLYPDNALRYVFGSILFFITLYISAFVTGKILSPFKETFASAHQEAQKNIIGSTAIVRTSSVTMNFGEATLDDGGAGLIVKVRAYKEGETFTYGDKVVLLEYDAAQHAYHVISEQEFING